MNYNVPLLGESCPWYELSKMAPTNIKWCEASVCGIINEPANTWSNLVYLILTIWAYREVKNNSDKTLLSFVPAFFLMGLFSFAYHASYNFFAQWFDFLGMFLMTGLFISLNLNRLKILPRDKMKSFYMGFLAFFGIMVIIFYLTYINIQLIIVVQALFLIFSELKLRKVNPDTKYKNFILGLVFILAAATFSVLDVTRVLCDPHNHYFQGHALWHLLSAISLGFVFKFYSQFDYSE